jgi:hypothetical protein
VIFSKKAKKMSSLEVQSSSMFEIVNGIVGVKRDVIFQLIEVIHFRCDEIIQNVF